MARLLLLLAVALSGLPLPARTQEREVAAMLEQRLGALELVARALGATLERDGTVQVEPGSDPPRIVTPALHLKTDGWSVRVPSLAGATERQDGGLQAVRFGIPSPLKFLDPDGREVYSIGSPDYPNAVGISLRPIVPDRWGEPDFSIDITYAGAKAGNVETIGALGASITPITNPKVTGEALFHSTYAGFRVTDNFAILFGSISLVTSCPAQFGRVLDDIAIRSAAVVEAKRDRLAQAILVSWVQSCLDSRSDMGFGDLIGIVDKNTGYGVRTGWLRLDPVGADGLKLLFSASRPMPDLDRMGIPPPLLPREIVLRLEATDTWIRPTLALLAEQLVRDTEGGSLRAGLERAWTAVREERVAALAQRPAQIEKLNASLRTDDGRVWADGTATVQIDDTAPVTGSVRVQVQGLRALVDAFRAPMTGVPAALAKQAIDWLQGRRPNATTAAFDITLTPSGAFLIDGVPQ